MYKVLPPAPSKTNAKKIDIRKFLPHPPFLINIINCTVFCRSSLTILEKFLNFAMSPTKNFNGSKNVKKNATPSSTSIRIDFKPSIIPINASYWYLNKGFRKTSYFFKTNCSININWESIEKKMYIIST